MRSSSVKNKVTNRLFSKKSYIYNHPKTDCFVISDLFNVARHMWCYKLESKSD